MTGIVVRVQQRRMSSKSLIQLRKKSKTKFNWFFGFIQRLQKKCIHSLGCTIANDTNVLTPRFSVERLIL